MMQLDVTYSSSWDHYRLITDVKNSNTSNCLEFCIGKFRRKWGLNGSVYLSEESFEFIQGCFKKNFSGFEDFGENDIPKHSWLKIIKCLELHAEQISSSNNIKDLEKSCQIYSDVREWLQKDYTIRKSLLIDMINDLCVWLRETLRHHKYVSVLGM